MEAKKYRISAFYKGLYIAVLIMVNIYTIMSVPLGFTIGWVIGFVIFDIIYFIYFFYQLFFDFGAGKFSLDEYGMTMYIGSKVHHMRWCDCVEFGIVGVRVEQAASTFWVYCAKRPLTPQEKKKFLSKTRRDLDLVHYFQYSKEPFEEMLKYIPADKAQQLRAQFSLIKMNPIEKLYHHK